MQLATIDWIILIVYAAIILFIGLFVSRKDKNKERSTEDYFLAGKNLTWWAIGASLIAANISAEQFIGVSGSGFAIGLAIGAYEWIAALTLIIVGKYFLPIFIKTGIYTIPEFIEKRFSTNLKTILSFFWIGVFIFVNLTSVLYLGGKAIDTIVGAGDGSLIVPSIIALALFAAAYSIWGGLSAVAWTDIIQVVLLIVGGFITIYIAIDKLGGDNGVVAGFTKLFNTLPPEKFTMILKKGQDIMPNGGDAYFDLPGLSVVIGGLWIANFYYWGFNQYVIQRTLAAKSLKEGQRGVIFAAALKLLVPIIVVVPGMIAFAMFKTDMFGAHDAFTMASGHIDNDMAYPWLIKSFIPVGLKGLVLAALCAAIVSSLASMVNSTSTIFTMDVYKPLINKKANNRTLIKVGRIASSASLLIACLVAPLLGNIGQAFQYIQEYTGIVTPGIFAVFFLGLFWKKTTNNAAIWGVILSLVFSIIIKVISKTILPTPMPWMHEIEITFVLTTLVIVGISLYENKGADDVKSIQKEKGLFHTEPIYNIIGFLITLILATIYIIFK